MYTNNNLREFPYNGTFYIISDYVPEDGDLLAEGVGTTTEQVVLNTSCDIHQTNKVFGSGVIQNQWTVFFTFDKSVGLPPLLRLGNRFRSEMYGMPIEGTVIGLWATEVAPFQDDNIGGCTAEIKGSDV